jgi:hypothetical protein
MVMRMEIMEKGNRRTTKRLDNERWPTIEQILRTEVRYPRYDPFFHEQQFPMFMKRSSLLANRYEKGPMEKTAGNGKGKQKVKKVDRFSPSQKMYEAYGRIYRHQSQGSPRRGENTKNEYDEAMSKQDIFANSSPNDRKMFNAFKHSTYPVRSLWIEDSPGKQGKQAKVKIQDSWDQKINDRERFSRESVNVIMIRSMTGRDESRNYSKEEDEIAQMALEQANKARAILDAEKTIKKNKIVKTGTAKVKKPKIAMEKDLMRYTLPLIHKPNNLSS